MTDYWSEYAHLLIENGLRVTPIRPGGKRPAISAWQKTVITINEVPRFRGCGVGVLCGVGDVPIVALDIDTKNERLATRFAEWCLETLGPAPERVGEAPKRLLVYRASEAGWAKAASAWFADPENADEKGHRLEALAKGQQFVAYHVHPGTGKPYEWVDILGGLAATPIDIIPVITKDQVSEAIATFERMAEEEGLVRVGGSASISKVTASEDYDPLAAYEPPVGITIEEAKQLLTHVDNEDYDTWLRVGMSLHHEFSGGIEGLDLWDEWSRSARNYIGREDLLKRWDSFGKHGHRPVTARWLLKVGKESAQDAEIAEKRAEVDALKEEIAACSDTIKLTRMIAPKAGAIAGSDRAIRAELAGAIRARFRSLTGTNLPIAEVRAAMYPTEGHKALPPESSRKNLTEFGNADRLIERHGKNLMYVPEIDAWYAWNGVYWARVPMVHMEYLAKETINSMIDEANTIADHEERMNLLKHCVASQKAMAVRNMIDLARSSVGVVVSIDELDKHSHLLGAKNGVIDLRTGELLPPDRSYRITKSVAVEYDPYAQCPLWLSTLNDIFMSDEEMIAFIQRLIGYTMMGDPVESIIVIPYGQGANGKNTIFENAQRVLGDYARTSHTSTFLTEGNSAGSAGAPREDILRLMGSRYVYVNEPSQGSVLREGLVKSMTGGESIPARGLYSRHTVEVKPTWTVVMPTNHKPIITGEDYGIWRRILTIPFERNLEKDPTIKYEKGRKDRIFREEAKGLLAWFVRGALEYQRIGLQPPKVVSESRESYKQEMDRLSDWISECCEVGPGFVETSSRLWASWEAFARSRGELRYIPSAVVLSRRLQSKGFKPIKDTHGIRGRGFVGIRVTTVGDFS